MKRILAFLLASTLLLALPLPTSAAVVEPVQPCFTYINSTYINFLIDETTGIAGCTAQCTANTGLTVLISGTLQQFINGDWEDVKSWVSTGTTYATLGKQWAVYSGYMYKFKATYKIYNSKGVLLETHTASKTYYYPGT